jgi:Methyltransferase domain
MCIGSGCPCGAHSCSVEFQGLVDKSGRTRRRRTDPDLVPAHFEQVATPQPRFSADPVYTDRAGKARYIAEKYAAILRGVVLDVGCDAAPLRGLVAQPDAYVGVDMRQDADVRLNLDAQDLPFDDGSFDTVVCTDVLEHLERCHHVFDELCRVSRRHIIASLPNPARVFLEGVFAGSGGEQKYYGLPVDPPADRHRWFFGYDDAVRFFTARGQRLGFSVEQIDAQSTGSLYWRNGQGQDVLDTPNLNQGTIWCVLART